MAIYHFSAKTGTLSGGQSARAKFDYIAREGSQHEHRDARLHVESGNMPKFASADPAAYWSAADANERANGRLFKHIEIALSRELTFEQNLDLARSFCDRIATSVPGGKLPYTFTIHAGGGSNPHFDVMFSERLNDAIDRGPEIWFSRAATGKNKTEAEGGARKTDALKPKKWLYGARKLWADLANDALAKAGHSARIDHRSLVDQRAEALAKGDLARAAALDRAPGEHIGPKALAFEKRHDGKVKSQRRKHIESRQRERRNIARKVVAVDLATSRYESQIRADQDALRRERGLRTKDAITRRIAAERAAGKTPASVVRPVSPAPAAAGAAASQPKKPASLTPTPAGGGKPKFHSARIAVAVDHKANATIEQKIRKEEQASLDFFESLNKKQQESLEKFMREWRKALTETHDEQQEQQRTRAPAPAAPAGAASQSQRAEREAISRRVLESMNAKPAPAPAAPAAAQPQVSPSPAPASGRLAVVDPRAAKEARDRESAERRIRSALASGKGRSAALVDAVRIADAGSIERLVDAGADATANRGAALEAAAQAKRDDLFGKLLRGVPLQDHSDLQQLAQQVGPAAAAKLRELSKAAKLGGSLQAAGIEQPQGPEPESGSKPGVQFKSE